MSKSQGGILDDHTFDGFRLDTDPFKDSKEEIGKGTYGTVYKVSYRGVARAAKEFYPKGKKSSDKKDSLKKYLRYAQLPQQNNIVQVLGVYGRKAIQPEVLPMILVMELMDCSLNSLLERGSEISNSTKLSILLDVSLGLKFLHSQDPPIAHYYLSSSNILLTAERKAKISDIGVTQMVAYKNEDKSQKGLPFMAPELRKSNTNSGPPADVFSFGVVMLHTVTEKHIAILTAAKQAKQPECYHYQSQCDQVVADSFFKQLSELVKSCLLNDPKSRLLISLASQFIENLTRPSDVTNSPATSSDHAESPASHGHDEAQQTLGQVQPSNFIADVGSKTLELTTAKSMPSLPYRLENHGPKVIGFQNLGNTCFFNSMLQCINQTVDLHYAITKGKRVYLVENSIQGLLPVEVTKPSHGVTSSLQSFFSGVNQHYNTISPYNLLHALGRNNYRFGRGTQEDSHEVLRCLLSGLREEEINCIRQGIYSHYNVSQNFLKDRNIDGETKLSIKEYLSKVSKGVCDIDCTFGVEIVTTTICHECQTPLQLKEICLDLALPMPPHNVTQMNDGRHGSVVTSKEKFNKHLKKKKLHYHNPLPSANFKTQLEGSLWAFTKLDVLDEKNKFICHSCSNAHNFQITQCRVSKQILIHKLSPVLILQMKRFTIGSHNVTKDNQHVSFPRVLDMAPYCTAECLEDFADSKGKILYGLYAIVVHGGSLHGGHYTACVRQRPLKKSLLKQQPDVSQQTYNAKAAEDGQWYYTSDSHVSGCGFDRVKGSQAYLLFYELLPGNEYLREVKRIRKVTKDQNKTDEVDEIANQIKESIVDDIAGLNRLQTKVDEISQEIKERKSSYEDALQNVENLHTKYQQIVKQQQEDQANQAATFEFEAKRSNDKIEELKNALMKNDAVNKDKIKGLDEKISNQNAEVEKLKVAKKEAEDSKETAKRECQQTLERHKTEAEKEKKELQDALTEKNMRLQESEEGRLALEKRCQQLLEQFEQLKSGKQHLLANKDTALLDKNKEPVKHDDSQSNEEAKQTLDQYNEYDAQSSHNNGAQTVRTEQQIGGEPLENDKKQESDKQNSESLGNTEQQGINEEQGDDKYLENDEHWQTGQLQENEEQRINIGQQHSSDKQEDDAKKESAMTKQQQSSDQTGDGDQQPDTHKDGDPDQQKNTDQTEDGNQQGNSQKQKSKQETDDLTEKDPGNQGENQIDGQDNNSGKDLVDQQVQHVDEKDCTYIVPVTTDSDMDKGNSTTGESCTYIIPTKSSSGTHEEIIHKMGNTEKNNQELPISKQHQSDQITGAGNQQQAIDHKTHQQPVENQKEHDAQSSHDNDTAMSAEQQISGEPLENDKKQGSDKENSENLGSTEQRGINEEQGNDKHTSNDEYKQTYKLQENKKQQINIEQLQHSNEEKDDARKESAVTKQPQNTDQDKDGNQQHGTHQDKDPDQPHNNDQTEDGDQQPDAHKDKDPDLQQNTDQAEDSHQQGSSKQQKCQQETGNFTEKGPANQEENQTNDQLQQDNNSAKDLEDKQVQHVDEKDCTQIVPVTSDSDMLKGNNTTGEACTYIVPTKTALDTYEENSHKMGNAEKNNQESPISKRQHQPDQVTRTSNQQQASDHKTHKKPVEKQKNQNNDAQSVNDRPPKNDDELFKQQQQHQPREDSEQQSIHRGEQQKNDEQVDNTDKNDHKKLEERQQSSYLSQPNNQHRRDPENQQIDGDKSTKVTVKKIDSDKENNTTVED